MEFKKIKKQIATEEKDIFYSKNLENRNSFLKFEICQLNLENLQLLCDYRQQTTTR